MVNFGGYLKAVRDEAVDGPDLYFVPYGTLKEFIFSAVDDFEGRWTEAFHRSCTDVSDGMTALWASVFAAVAPAAPEEARGAPLGAALRAFLTAAGSDAARELLQRLAQLHTAAASNAEALRKLIKKHDKYHAARALSASRLPTLYASTVFMSQSLLEQSLGTLRELLNEEDGGFLPMRRHDSDAIHLNMIESRIEELQWLKRLVASIPPAHMQGLVAHRGFHHIKDRSDKRPLENSLAAYELAWTSGIHLCECDIALTKDEKLVLAHDDDFQRLALENSGFAAMKVSELTFRELISLPLKTGMRPPLLIDVLRSAHAISDNARLIIEIKPGNVAAASALARMLFRHPELCSCVAMIMSFDAFTIHKLRTEFAAALAVGGRPSLTAAAARPLGHSHHRLLSMDHFGTLVAAAPPPLALGAVSPTGASFGKAGLPPRSNNSSSNNCNHRRYQSDVSSSFASSMGFDFADPPGRGLDTIGMDLSQTNLSQLAGPNGQHHSTTDEVKEEPSIVLPKLMLLTVASPSSHPCEMHVSVNDLSPVDSWLAREDGSLDGVYLQYEAAMMTEAGSAALRALSERYMVGIWGHSGKDPDDYATFEWLKSQCNVTFVNTDLPNQFRRDIFKDKSYKVRT